MTAHTPKPTITPERIAWFAEYYRRRPAWGVFHVTLDDGNWKSKAYLGHWRDEIESHPADVGEAAEWFDRLTPSQRRKLAAKAEGIVDGGKSWYHGPFPTSPPPSASSG